MTITKSPAKSPAKSRVRAEEEEEATAAAVGGSWDTQPMEDELRAPNSGDSSAGARSQRRRGGEEEEEMIGEDPNAQGDTASVMHVDEHAAAAHEGGEEEEEEEDGDACCGGENARVSGASTSRSHAAGVGIGGGGGGAREQERGHDSRHRASSRAASSHGDSHTASFASPNRKRKSVGAVHRTPPDSPADHDEVIIARKTQAATGSVLPALRRNVTNTVFAYQS